MVACAARGGFDRKPFRLNSRVSTIQPLGAQSPRAADPAVLKTIIPSRKATKQYLGEESDDEEGRRRERVGSLDQPGERRMRGEPLNNLKKRHGGARPNSGPKKGAKYAKTIAKEQAREALRAIVLRELEPLVQAQIAHAMA